MKCVKAGYRFKSDPRSVMNVFTQIRASQVDSQTRYYFNIYIANLAGCPHNEWVAHDRLRKFSNKVEHPKSLLYYFNLELILDGRTRIGYEIVHTNLNTINTLSLANTVGFSYSECVVPDRL